MILKFIFFCYANKRWKDTFRRVGMVCGKVKVESFGIGFSEGLQMKKVGLLFMNNSDKITEKGS